MLACSAGGDSMALLHLFAEAAAKTPPGRESPRGWQLAVRLLQ